MKSKKVIIYSIIVISVLCSTAYFLIFVKERLKAPQWNLQSNTIIIDDIERTFDFYIPDKLSNSPAIVFLLHGSNVSNQIMRYLTNYEFEKQADQRKNFILVYPQGFEKHWNDCRGTANYKANILEINEIDFFKGMITFFSKNYKIDRDRIFSVGYSNGGHMCFKLAFELPELFKGIGTYSASIPEQTNNDCNPKNMPISAIIINGTADPINPFNGGLVVLEGDSSRGNVMSSANTFKYFSELLPDTCKNQKVIESNYSNKVLASEILCNYPNYRVKLVTVKDGGHTIPLTSKPPYLPSRLGKTEMGINSAAIILDFFESIE